MLALDFRQEGEVGLGGTLCLLEALEEGGAVPWRGGTGQAVDSNLDCSPATLQFAKPFAHWLLRLIFVTVLRSRCYHQPHCTHGAAGVEDVH